MNTTPPPEPGNRAATPPAALPRTMLLAAVGVAAFLAAAIAVYFYKNPRPSEEMARLEHMVEIANTACVSNSDVESAAKVGAGLSLLLENVKGEGGVTEYRKKHIGADNTLPAELQPPENAKIRECMDRYMPAIIEAITGIHVQPPPDANAGIPNPVQLRFSYSAPAQGAVSLDDTLRVNLQTSRRIVDGERLAQQAGGYYSYNAAYPTEGEELLGTLVREVRASSLDAAPVPVRFCLKRPMPLQSFAEQYVHLDCTESGSCQIHFPSPKWLEPCAVKPQQVSRAFSFISQAFAADGERRWLVPSAQTLAAHKGQLKGVGYTIFSVETDALRDPAVIGVEVDIRVNGVPIDEDGLPPRLRPVPNQADKPFRHSFALESLDFQGAQAGCEAVVLTLTPRMAGGKGLGTAQSVTLPYVALRDQARETLAFGKATLTWDARYVIPADEWSHEAFITAVTYSTFGGDAAAAAARQRAVALKQAFDRLGLTFRGLPLVAVIRPPLTQSADKLSYGLAAGVVQDSGQVRFTFSNAEADAIATALLEARTARAGAAQVINRDRYVYKAAGNATRQSTPTPPGVCLHVKAG